LPLNLGYGRSSCRSRCRARGARRFRWRASIRFAALLGLARLRGVGLLVAVIAINNLAQFILHAPGALYGVRFGWGPREVGLSLFVVGLVATIVQGGLLGVMMRLLGERRVVLFGLASGTLLTTGYALTTQAG